MTIVWSRRAVSHLVALHADIRSRGPAWLATIADGVLAAVDMLAHDPRVERAGAKPRTGHKRYSPPHRIAEGGSGISRDNSRPRKTSSPPLRTRYPASMATLQRLPVDQEILDFFCRRWKISSLELFGSTLVDSSRARDIDLLVTFSPDAEWGLFDHAHMEDELSGILGKKVDLVSRRAIERSANSLRRNSILGSAIPVYVAG